MKKVLIGILIGISIILMCLMFIGNKFDKIQTKGHRLRRKYVKLKPESYKYNL